MKKKEIKKHYKELKYELNRVCNILTCEQEKVQSRESELAKSQKTISELSKKIADISNWKDVEPFGDIPFDVQLVLRATNDVLYVGVKMRLPYDIKQVVSEGFNTNRGWLPKSHFRQWKILE